MWVFVNGILVIIINLIVLMFILSFLFLFGDIKLMFYVMGVLFMLILLLNGYKLRFKYNIDSIRFIIVFSIYYVFLMGILVLFSIFILDSNINFFNIINYGIILIM